MASFTVAPQPPSPRKVSFQVSVTAIDNNTNGSHVTRSLASPRAAADDDEIVLDAGGDSALQRTRDTFSSLDLPTVGLQPDEASPALLAIQGQNFGDGVRFSGETAVSPPPSINTERGYWSYASLGLEDHDPPPAHEDDDGPLSCFSNKLFRAMVGKPKLFMPLGRLHTLVRMDAVRSELQTELESLDLDEDFIETKCRKICGGPKQKSYRNIFALLVLLDKTKHIFSFLRDEVSDDDIPLRQHFYSESSTIFDLRRGGDAGKVLPCFKGWRHMALQQFFDYQWYMLATFFTKRDGVVQDYQLQKHDILPFTFDSRHDPHKDSITIARGGFGQVFKVRIHPNHHNFGPQSTRGFAIKELFSKNPDDWKREVESLKRISRTPHAHLIELLATYEQQGSKYLLFSWADSDLLKYWSLENNNPSMDLETVRWVAQQCAGICDGLSMIHRDVKKPLKDRYGGTLPLYGRHGDIKPRNTLWFRDAGENEGKGTLKITDFGIAEVNSKTSRSKKTNGHIDFSPTYCPPEVRMPGGEISRSFDIWTLGCLYLEFATWLLGGWPLVKRFQGLRRMKDAAHPNAHLDTFFEIVKDSRTGVLAARVKPEVTRFITELHAHQSCTRFIHAFLDIIEGQMLIVESDYVRRSCAQEIHTALAELERMCNWSGDFAISPAISDVERLKNRASADAVAVAVVADIPENESQMLSEKYLRPHTGTLLKRATF